MIGNDEFGLLRSRSIVLANGRSSWGEPDLFCWEPSTKKWFFAEAKGPGDDVQSSQDQWGLMCKECLGAETDLRLYFVNPSQILRSGAE